MLWLPGEFYLHSSPAPPPLALCLTPWFDPMVSPHAPTRIFPNTHICAVLILSTVQCVCSQYNTGCVLSLCVCSLFLCQKSSCSFFPLCFNWAFCLYWTDSDSVKGKDIDKRWLAANGNAARTQTAANRELCKLVPLGIELGSPMPETRALPMCYTGTPKSSCC